MSERITVGAYTIFVDTTTGEVAVRNNLTGQILATNPYDVASAGDAIKATLMNQISLKFCNVQDNKETTFGSFNDSALRGQITVKNIRNGIRVEYTLGKEASKQLIPGWVEYTRFMSLIYEPALENCFTEQDFKEYQAANPNSTVTLEERRMNRFNRLILSNYQVIDPNDPNNSEAKNQQIARDYPCCKEGVAIDYDGDGVNDKMKIYAIVKNLSERNRNSIESAVKQYTNYTFEDLQYDTQMTKYPGEDSNPALFRLALEYTLNEEGFEVRLPANSIRFNEDMYRLISIDVLPYFGTTSNDYTGYTFIPDGSGAIIRNEEIIADGKNQYSIRGQIYGPDFSYHNITSHYNGKDKIMHLPVYGAIEDTVMVKDNLDNQVGFIWIENNLTDAGGNQLYYTANDRIMKDAVNEKGELVTTLADYLAQFKVNDAGDVIRIGDKLWDSADYTGTIEIGTDEDPLSNYNVYVESGEVPYVEIVSFYLMAPAVDEEGEIITYKGKTVYVYVDAEGNPVDEENRVEGVLKIREQLWYNGQPAYYETNVPVDPSKVLPDSGATETPDEDAPADGEEAPEDTEAPSEEEAPADTEAEETTEEIEYYNKVPKVEEKYDEPAYEEIETIVSQGYFAIITEGDALCNITSYHGGTDPENPTGGEHKYNSVYITVFPRPQDSYRLADAISVSNDSAEWVVVSERKYTGSYRVQYTMLTDATYIENGAIKETKYEASYVGMSEVYRDYLLKSGTLTALTDVDDDIPLYLETFGMTTQTKVVATIPMVMDVALTSFEDLRAMYSQLDGDGIDNVNFRLVGFTKGGLYSFAPSAAKFESVVGGNGDYEDMVKYCEEISAKSDKHLNIFPDFDFANVSRVGAFDGFDPLDDAARTIDDRYSSKREYDSTYQSFSPVGSITVSPAVYQKLYDAFAKKIDKLGVSGISVGSLGTDLNSDFDTDEPYNREDSKYFTVELLKQLSEKYGNIMIDGGNSFALPYADYILNMPLDSSLRSRASAAVPFMGMVFHGYINYAGTATGMASDIDREILKIIENGAAPYFTVAYQNTAALKDDISYSDYYSIDYQICYEQIVETYKTLNQELADLQTAHITNHTFVEGVRALGEKEQAEVDALMAAAKTGYEDAVAAAQKAYNDRKALAERHGEEFTEVFEETYAYLATADSYVQYVYDEYCLTLDRVVSGSNLVLVEYTRKDGTTKTFVLNYGAYDATVVVGESEIDVSANGFAVVGQ
ncbi:MAG: hypothetical protein IJW46_05300 [Clostridia bacterium]|nr:hypothetical protein [Clostridia bacterium]